MPDYDHDLDLLVFIGRFQPFHRGHKAVVDQALRRARALVMVIGSADAPRTARNPFTYDERVAMISAAYPDEVKAGKLLFLAQTDDGVSDERWAATLAFNVEMLVPDSIGVIGLIGHKKDATSFYLSLFPQWESIGVTHYDNINATDIRNGLYEMPIGSWRGAFGLDVPEAIMEWLEAWGKATFNGGVLSQLRAEHEYLVDYRRQFSNKPYPPVFVTVDAVVTQSGHVLLVKRGAQPGKGLWALPGGFLEQHETIENGVLRELREETLIDLPDATLRALISDRRVFDDPFRSQRGRTITHAFHIELEPRPKLPKVKGSDDAVNAVWLPLREVRRDRMFEDHYSIIQAFTGI